MSEEKLLDKIHNLENQLDKGVSDIRKELTDMKYTIGEIHTAVKILTNAFTDSAKYQAARENARVIKNLKIVNGKDDEATTLNE